MYMKTPINIVYIHQDGHITGSAISLKNLISGFQPGQVNATLIIPSEGPLRAFMEEAGVKVICCPFQSFWTFPGPRWYSRNNLQMYRALIPNRTLLKLVIKMNPDIIHINDKAAMAVGISLKKSGIPIVQHLRSNFHKTRFRFNKWLSVRLTKKYTDQFIAISEDETDGFDDSPNLQIIYNTIHPILSANAIANKKNICEEFKINKGDAVICYVGLYNELKGAWDYIKTCGILKKMLPEKRWHFLFIAPIPGEEVKMNDNGQLIHPYDKAKKLAAEVGIQNEIIFTGYRKDALSLIAASDLLLIMNKQGVLGRQPFEAMSVGVPVIAVAGQSSKTNIVRTGINGVLLNTYSPELIAREAAGLITNEEYRHKLGVAGKEIANAEFNPHINSQKVVALYHKLIKK